VVGYAKVGCTQINKCTKFWYYVHCFAKVIDMIMYMASFASFVDIHLVLMVVIKATREVGMVL